LGLAITKSIVEMMNGSIEVESEKGVGTTFVITVTMVDAESAGADSDAVEMHPHEMSVLVIDDDHVACEHAKLVLSEVGIAADIADSGSEAVGMVRVRGARRDPYDLILVDWKMPDMDGVETTRQIRSIAGDDSAIIILTAYNWDDVLEEALHAGVDSFLAKPLFASTVIEEFQKALKQRAAMSEERKRADLPGRRVLLAEDVEINAEIMMELMKTREVTVDHAPNGKIAVEMFEVPDADGGTRLVVNELAMRPHNSGHWTMDGSVTSQFEQHLRAVLDLPPFFLKVLDAPKSCLCDMIIFPQSSVMFRRSDGQHIRRFQPL